MSHEALGDYVKNGVKGGLSKAALEAIQGHEKLSFPSKEPARTELKKLIDFILERKY